MVAAAFVRNRQGRVSQKRDAEVYPEIYHVSPQLKASARSRVKHYGIICPPVRGHVNPFLALARELQRRGHRVTVFHMPDLEASVRQEEVDFVSIGGERSSRGLARAIVWPHWVELSGLAALRFTVQSHREDHRNDLPRCSAGDSRGRCGYASGGPDRTRRAAAWQSISAYRS